MVVEGFLVCALIEAYRARCKHARFRGRVGLVVRSGLAEGVGLMFKPYLQEILGF